MQDLGLSSKIVSQWRDNALSIHLIEKVENVYQLASWEKAGRISRCSRLFRGVHISFYDFITKRWLSLVWSGFLIHFRNRPITRNTLFTITAIPPGTQFEYERKARVKIVENYADFGGVEEYPLFANGLSHSEGHYIKAGRIRRRLCNSYLPKKVRLANKGRLKQVNAALRISEGSSQKTVYRLYCEGTEEPKRTLRANRRIGEVRNRPDFLFQFCVHLPKGTVWNAIQC